jgi:hypothetical protein
MSKTTTLASGQITTTDPLHLELREPEEFPATIFIIWPQASSVVDPRQFGATAGAVARLMVTAINVHGYHVRVPLRRSGTYKCKMFHKVRRPKTANPIRQARTARRTAFQYFRRT